ncbi:MAG TPA: HutD family protein [Gemmatimonadaceae bacterium]|nr:HutD family protein [Gemmatimonadaceae bacterium]
MRILKSDEYRRMPWRNGRGETAEVAIGPAGATIDDFDWRVSMAHIDGDGPFSIFPQTDRTLAVLRGDGLCLSIAGSAPLELTRDSEPLSFSGDVTVAATLLGAPVTDLNVMTRRERSGHSMRRLRIVGRAEIPLEAPLALLICADGSLQIEVDAQTGTLMTLEALLVEDGRATLRISSDASALAYLIEIH